MDNVTAHKGNSMAIPKDKLLEDLRLVVEDAEDLLHATASQAGDRAAAARARIEQNLQLVKERMVSAEAAVVSQAKDAARSTDRYVHEHPWQAMGVSACIGAVIGMLIARR